MIEVKIVNWVGWEKMPFADLVKDAKSVAGHSAFIFHQFRVVQDDVTLA